LVSLATPVADAKIPMNSKYEPIGIKASVTNPKAG
jgi:hypothetical protein